MVGGTLHEERLRGVHPQLILLVRAWEAQLPWRILICSGVRTDAQQAALYAQGRTAPGKIVTNAPTAAESPHGRRYFNGTPWGCAIDAVRASDSGEALWEDLDSLEQMAEVAERLGMVWGGRWKRLKDWDHFELPEWRLWPHAKDGGP